MQPRTLLPRFASRTIYTGTVMDTPATPPRRSRRKRIVLSILALFLLPIAARAALYAYEGGPEAGATPTGRSTGSLPAAAAEPEARVLVMSGRTGGWKGVFSVHSWVVLKPENGKSWRRYDVVGWGNPVRINGWAPDGLLVRQQAAGGARSARRARPPRRSRRSRPRSRAINTPMPATTASGRGRTATPSSRPCCAPSPRPKRRCRPNAVGRDFRPLPYAGLTDSRTGVEASLWGVLGVKLGWVEGVEVNFLGLVAGLDLRHPGIKLPGFGRIGLPQQTATARDQRDNSLHVDLHAGVVTGTPASARLAGMHDTLARCLKKFRSRRSAAAGSTRLQINVGYRCNQSCLHCHVGASPHRTEEMSGDGRRRRCWSSWSGGAIATLDITGGAPELNRAFPPPGDGGARNGRARDGPLQPHDLRGAPGQEDLPEFLAARAGRDRRLAALLSRRTTSTASAARACSTRSIRGLQPPQRAGLRARRLGPHAQSRLQSARAVAAAAAGRARGRLQAHPRRAATASRSTASSRSPTCRSSASARRWSPRASSTRYLDLLRTRISTPTSTA